MSDVISRIKLESNEFDSKIKRATQNLLTMEQECRKVNGTLAVLEKEQLEYVRSLGRMETVSNSARGKVNELTQAFTELSVQYNRLTDEEKKGDYGKALSASLEQLKNRINEGKNELNDINKSLNGGGGLSDALNSVAGKFGLSIDQVTKFGGVVGLTTTAVQVCKDAFFNSESNIDEWGRTVKGAEGAYQVFLDTLNNGNWSNFFHNLSLAIQGGRDLYDVFDRLGSIKSNNAAAIAIVQQQIAQLRLAKQQGENVDAQLKAATERLASLQKQSVTAGMNAGNMSAFQTIRNGVNSIGGAGVNDATIQYVVNRIMKGGQAEFDKYKRNYEVLQKRGTGMTTSYQTTAYGGTMAVQKREFNIANLTQEEQKQYALAKAITEGETRIQKGIAAYAQAVQEGTASAREQFKGNRYALQGSGGSGGGIKGGSTFNPDSIAFKAMDGVKADHDRYFKSVWAEIGEAGRRQIAEMMDKQTFDLKKDTSTDWVVNSKGQLVNKKQGKGKDSEGGFIKGIDNVNDTLSNVGGSINNIFSSLQQMGIEIPQGIASVLGALNIITSILTFIQSVVAIKSILPFANGGIVPHAALGYAVPGNHYSGDVTPIMANAGEVILSQGQQNRIVSALSGAGGGGGRLVAKLKGRDILISLERELSETGKGQLATWR